MATPALQRYVAISRKARRQRTPAEIRFHRAYRREHGPLTAAQRSQFSSPSRGGGGAYVTQLRGVLRGTPLAPYAALIARTEARNNLPRGSIAGIAKAESSFGTAGSPTRGFNAWGWTNGGPPNFRSFPNWETAIRQYGKFLGSSYGDALRSGGPAAIADRYVGYAAPAWVDNVRSVMSRFAAGVPDAPAAGAGRGRGRSTQAASPSSDERRRLFLALALASRSGSGNSTIRAFLPIVLNALAERETGRDPAAEANAAPVQPSRGIQMVGRRGLRLPRTFTRTHWTSGLEGYAAHDWLEKAGTPVGAPDDGTVIRISGSNDWHGSVGGRSIYIQTKRGVYFLTHFGPNLRVKKGDKVRANQILGYVGNPTTSMAEHIHQSFRPF